MLLSHHIAQQLDSENKGKPLDEHHHLHKSAFVSIVSMASASDQLQRIIQEEQERLIKHNRNLNVHMNKAQQANISLPTDMINAMNKQIQRFTSLGSKRLASPSRIPIRITEAPVVSTSVSAPVSAGVEKENHEQQQEDGVTHGDEELMLRWRAFIGRSLSDLRHETDEPPDTGCAVATTAFKQVVDDSQHSPPTSSRSYKQQDNSELTIAKLDSAFASLFAELDDDDKQQQQQRLDAHPQTRESKTKAKQPVTAIEFKDPQNRLVKLNISVPSTRIGTSRAQLSSRATPFARSKSGIKSEQEKNKYGDKELDIDFGMNTRPVLMMPRPVLPNKR
jgi:hypothetical protein